MNKEIMIKYVELLNQYKLNNNISFNVEELSFIKQVNKEAINNIELYNLIESIKKLSNETEIKKIIDDYFNKIENSSSINNNNIEKEIEKTFGIDINNIHHHFLDNGNEIFYFYDLKLNKNVVLENKKDGKSLVEQLKEMQVKNESYQTENNIQNTNNMLEYLRQNDMEVKMIDINEIHNYTNQLNNLNEEQTKKLRILISSSNQMNIKYVNIENMLAIDNNNRILEVKHDKEKDIYNIVEPNEGIYNEQDINTSDRIDTTYTEQEQINNLQNEYEDKPEVNSIDDLDEETLKQVETYYNYPELLNQLPDSEREKWSKYVEMYKDKKVKEMNQLDPPKQIIKKDERKAGYVDAVLLALITGFFGGIFTTIMTIIISK